MASLNNGLAQMPDTSLFWQQWQKGLNNLSVQFEPAHLLIEEAIFGYANLHFWNAASNKAKEYAEILAKYSKPELVNKWYGLAQEWEMERLGKPNGLYIQVIDNAIKNNLYHNDPFQALILLKKKAALLTKHPANLMEQKSIFEQIALLAEKTANQEDAYQAYNQLRTIDPQNPTYIIKLAHFAYQNQDYWLAKNYFLTQKFHNEPEMLLAIADCYAQLGLQDSAEIFLQKYHQHPSVSANTFTLTYYQIKGNIMLKAFAFQDALDAFQNALNLTNHNHEKRILYTAIAQTWMKLVLFDNAEKNFQQALLFANENTLQRALIIYELLPILIHKKQYAQAEKYLTEIQPIFIQKLGRFHYHVLGLYEIAIDLYTRKKDPQNAIAYLYLATDIAQHHPELKLKLLLLQRKLIASLINLFAIKENKHLLMEIDKQILAYFLHTQQTLELFILDEEMLSEIHRGLFLIALHYVKLFYKKNHEHYLWNAFAIQSLWKSIKQKQLQSNNSQNPEIQSLILQKQLTQKLILQEISKENPEPLKIQTWNAQSIALNNSILQLKKSCNYFFNPLQKKLNFILESNEAHIAFFITENQWLSFLIVNDHIFVKLYENDDELRKYLYLLKKGNDNHELTNPLLVEQKIAELLLTFPLNMLKKFPDIKTISFSLDTDLLHLDLDQLPHPFRSTTTHSNLLKNSYFIQRKMTAF